MSHRYDTIILGAGPGGLSAAVTLKIRNKDILVLSGEPVSTKVEKAHEIQNYLGLPQTKGADLAAHFLNHAQQMGVEIRQEQIFAVYAMGDFFALSAKSGQMYEAATVIIATGVSFGKPYPGEERFLGRGVSYCATCDAPLYKGKSVAVIADSPEEEAEAKFLAEIAQVTYLPTYKGEVSLPGITVVREKPLEIKGARKADTLVTEGGEISTDCVFILRQSVAPAQLVPGLALDGRHIAVNRSMETNLPGLFACGDITGLPYQYIKAAGEGNVAALSAVGFLSRKV